jgi:hypothetical protein
LEVDEPLDSLHRKKRQFLVAPITGLTSSQRIVIYGFGIAIGGTHQNTYTILKKFFEFVREDSETLLSDQRPCIISSIK